MTRGGGAEAAASQDYMYEGAAVLKGSLRVYKAWTFCVRPQRDSAQPAAPLTNHQPSAHLLGHVRSHLDPVEIQAGIQAQ